MVEPVERLGPGSFEVSANTVEAVSRALGGDGPPASIFASRALITSIATQVARDAAANRFPALESEPIQDTRKRVREALGMQGNVREIGVLGIAGAGKSSFINFMRKKQRGEDDYAPIGIRLDKEDTFTPYPMFDGRMRLWDTPNLYHKFPSHYVAGFHIIVLVVGGRITGLEENFVKLCAWYKVPLLIVKSKLDQDLESYRYDTGIDDAEKAFTDTVAAYKDAFATKVLPHVPQAKFVAYTAKRPDDEDTRRYIMSLLMAGIQ